MNIIEGYKQKAREGFNNAIATLQQDNEDDDRSQTTHQSRNKLIEEINGSNEPQDNYEEEQFAFFAGQVKQKQQKCVVCKKMNPKYTCPKCKVRYCSIEHYKTHNMYCSEKFYKGEVESLLKRTKMGKEEKKKMIDMLRANEVQQMEDSKELLTQTKVEEIDKARLQEILKSLENGEDVRLTESEINNFEAYLKDIEYTSYQDDKEKNEQKQDDVPLFQEYIPFWNIDEGLQQYFVIGESISVEDYNKSQHQEVIQYRRIASLSLRKQIETLLKGINLKKTSILIVYDLVQTIYLTTLLFRSFNGQYLNNPEFIANFTLLFDESLAKKVADSHPINLVEIALHDFPTVIPFLKSALSNMKDIESLSLFRSWLPLIMDDAQSIFKNKYLCLESLWRFIEALRLAPLSQSAGKVERKATTRRTQLVKKLQYLLLFTHQIVFNHQQETLPETFKSGVCLRLIKQILEKDAIIEKTIATGLKIAQSKEQLEKEEKLRKILC